MSLEAIKSVGIDIGTSTTKLILSELTLGRVSSHFALPHFDIINRKVTYVSEIISTPLKKADEIDLMALAGWLEREYRRIGLSLSEIKSGAVIITGETAIKKNADALLHYLAERSGDFVVAIAGASLEGVLAGRGSGASEYSKKVKGIVANIDIGGGTANVALFKQGKALDTVTFHVGGRLIEIDSAGEVLAVSESIQPWLFSKNFLLKKGMRLTLKQFSKLSSMLCKDMLDCLVGKIPIGTVKALVHSASSETLPMIDEVMISGGVGRLVLEVPPSTLDDAAKFNDIGPILAGELMKVLKNYPLSVVEAAQTSRATVIGAGMQTTKISGATISIAPEHLPLRNIPVVKMSYSETALERYIERLFFQGKELFHGNSKVPFAISLAEMPYLPYLKIKELAEVLGKVYARLFPRATALVVVCENDMAKALGQALRLQLAADVDVICIDQVVVEYGDYIDIGEPLNDTMVPVVVKTLAFS